MTIGRQQSSRRVEVRFRTHRISMADREAAPRAASRADKIERKGNLRRGFRSGQPSSPLADFFPAGGAVEAALRNLERPFSGSGLFRNTGSHRLGRPGVLGLPRRGLGGGGQLDAQPINAATSTLAVHAAGAAAIAIARATAPSILPDDRFLFNFRLPPASRSTTRFAMHIESTG